MHPLQYFLLPQHLFDDTFGGTFTKSPIKIPKRATTRYYDDRIIPDLFNVVFDTYGIDGFTIKARHRCLLNRRMRSYPQYFKLPQPLVARFTQTTVPITTPATQQALSMLSTTLMPVMASGLRPLIGACSMYGGARILNMSSSLSLWWHF